MDYNLSSNDWKFVLDFKNIPRIAPLQFQKITYLQTLNFKKLLICKLLAYLGNRAKIKALTIAPLQIAYI